jgi:hypothetical protein
MLIESNKLKTVSNYAADKDITRQHVYRLIKGNEINSINIDGVLFVIIDEKAKNFEKKRS